MTKLRICGSILSLGLFAFGPMALAEEFSTTPKRETLDEAIRFEKYKIAAADAQARKDAAESAANRKTSQSYVSKSGTATKTGQTNKPHKTDQDVSTNRK